MASQLTEKEVAKLKQQFLALDDNGSCDISISDLKQFLKDPNLEMSAIDIDALMKDLDLNGNGKIDSCEFLTLLSNRKDKELKDMIHKAIIIRSPIRKAFKEFDVNGDGFITKKEFRNVMKKHKGMVSDAQLEGMIKDANKNEAGKIDYDEFVLVITNKLLMYNMYGMF